MDVQVLAVDGRIGHGVQVGIADHAPRQIRGLDHRRGEPVKEHRSPALVERVAPGDRAVGAAITLGQSAASELDTGDTDDVAGPVESDEYVELQWRSECNLERVEVHTQCTSVKGGGPAVDHDNEVLLPVDIEQVPGVSTVKPHASRREP